MPFFYQRIYNTLHHFCVISIITRMYLSIDTILDVTIMTQSIGVFLPHFLLVEKLGSHSQGIANRLSKQAA